MFTLDTKVKENYNSTKYEEICEKTFTVIRLVLWCESEKYKKENKKY